jgi:parallel beta-helix repeat protein
MDDARARNFLSTGVAPLLLGVLSCGAPPPAGGDTPDAGPEPEHVVVLDGGVVVRAGCPASAVRWASSQRRVYVTGDVVCTLTDLARSLSPDLLERGGERTWLLRASLILERGAHLRLRGAAAGGDVDVLRLFSDDDGFVSIRADWGSIELDGVTVTSWDEDDGQPDRQPADGRAYLLVRSFIDGDGSVRRSRMDIRRSDIGWLGHDADEAYGLTWRVAEADPRLLDRVDVGGEVTDSRIHHNWFGAYTWGAQGMTFARNQIDNNRVYGLDPHDDSDDLVVVDNRIHHNGSHGFICSKRCDRLRVAGNQVWANGGSGILLHLAIQHSTVEDNLAHHNQAAGIGLVEASDNLIRGNHVHDNGIGIQLSARSERNRIEGNRIDDNRQVGLYFFPGDDPQAAPGGRPLGNLVSGNTIAGNQLAVNVTDSHDNLFEGNHFDDQLDELLFQDARDNLLRGNQIAQRSLIATKGDGRTIVEPMEKPLTVRAWDTATTTIRDPRRRAYLVEDVDEPTRVTPTESSLALDAEEADAPRVVAPLPLVAEIGEGALLVRPLRWSQTGGREFAAEAAGGEIAARFRIGGLAPGAEHQLLRDGVPLADARADAEGVLVFDDRVGARVTYLLR